MSGIGMNLVLGPFLIDVTFSLPLDVLVAVDGLVVATGEGFGLGLAGTDMGEEATSTSISFSGSSIGEAEMVFSESSESGGPTDLEEALIPS
jgi:hypothetical protein